MEITKKYNSVKVLMKDYIIDDYGNIDIYRISKELNEDNSLDINQLFSSVEASYRMELKINKELYKQGIISNELYLRVEAHILSKLSFFNNHLKT